MGYHGILWESMDKYVKMLMYMISLNKSLLKPLHIKDCQMVYKPGSVTTKW